MNTDIYLPTPINQLPEAAEDTAQKAIHVTNDAAHRATETAKEIFQSAALRAEDTLATSKDYLRRNPVPVVLGAIAIGAAIGYILMSARRKPTFGERFADVPLTSVRDALIAALTPVAQNVHEGYDTARDRVEKAMHRYAPGSSGGHFSDRLCRVGNNLKFW